MPRYGPRFIWVLPVLSCVKCQFAAEEENTDSVVFEGAEATSIKFDGVDFAVDPLADCVGNRMAKIRENVLQVVLDHPRNFHHLMPSSGQWLRGTFARMRISNRIVSRCRHLRSAARSAIGQRLPQFGQATYSPGTHCSKISTLLPSYPCFTSLTVHGL